MKPVRETIWRQALTATSLVFGMRKKVDYRTLSRHIIEINRLSDLDSILRQASLCLKEILDYQFFAFAVQDGPRMDVWIDPSVYKTPLRNVIEKDFSWFTGYQTHHLHDASRSPETVMAFRRQDLQSFVLMNDRHFAKLYVLPNGRMLPHHDEIVTIIVKTLGIALKNFMYLKHLENAAAFDPLTNCYNRREFDRLIEHNIATSRRHAKDMAVIMFDIDHFKKINDTYGHPAGDEVLVRVSRAVLDTVRKGDYLARYGGEEFVVVLPETKLCRAMELAERLRKIIENLDITSPDGRQIPVTASFGVAGLKGETNNKERLMKEVDDMLYKAKNSGRNRVMPGLTICLETVRKKA